MENERWISKQLSIIKINSLTVSVALLLVSFAFFYFWSEENFPDKLGWFQTGIALSLFFLAVPQTILRAKISDKDKLKLCTYTYDTGLAIEPLYYSYITIFVYPNSTLVEMAAFSVVIAGCCAGSVLTNMHSRLVSVMQVVLFLIPYSWVSFSLGTTFGYTLGAAGILFIFVLVAQIFLLHRLFKSEFLLSEKNSKLLEENKRNTEALVENSKMISLGRMAGGVAHEINNPLAILSGLVNRVRNRAASGKLQIEDIPNFSDRMDKSIERIVGIVNGLRQLARDEKATELKDYNVDVLIEDTLSFCKEKFKAHNVNIKKAKAVRSVYLLPTKSYFTSYLKPSEQLF